MIRPASFSASRGGCRVRPAFVWTSSIALAGHIVSATAAVPTLDHLFPAGVEPGTTNVITGVGKFEPWPARAWVDDPAIFFEAETNKGAFRVIVATNAVPGPHLVRVFNDEGASKPRFLIVEPHPQTAEKEPNDEYAAPQEIAILPATINGRLEKSGDVDSYAVTLATGQTLVASIEAYILGSPLDALLRVTDQRGVQLGWNHDGGHSLDPRLVFTARSAGRHVVQVMGFPHPATAAIRFHGSATCIYRLRLHAGPYASHTQPLGVQRHDSTALRVSGWNNISNTMPEQFSFDASALSPDEQLAAIQVPGAENTLRIPVGDGPEILESEPNNVVSNAQQLAGIPVAVSGCVESERDEDRFGFTAKKDEKLRLEVRAASFGFPLDSWLKIEDEGGKQIARNDDGSGPDPRLDWTAPSDGKFLAVVGSLLHRGGSNHLYRLAVSRLTPDVRATAADHSIAIKPGTTNSFKITVNRLHGFTNQLTAEAIDLPPAIIVEPAEIPAKGGEVTLKLVATTNAPAASAPFSVQISGAGLSRRAEYLLSSRTEDNGVPGGFQSQVIDATDQFWVTILPVPAADTNKVSAIAK